jgi:hypothetical protein
MKTKKEHYVPQLYLEAFARDGHLCAFDKATGKAFPSSVRDAASQRFFYDIPELDQAVGVSQAIEKFFNPFEDAAAPVLDSLRRSLGSGNFVAITQSQRIDLSIFFALQMLRTPESREHFVQLSLALHKHAFLSWVREQRPGLEFDASSFDLEMTEDEQIRTHARAILDHDLRDRIAEIIFQHCWVVLENPFSTPFITSDHPVCNHGTVSHPVRSMQGLASFGAEILFPISPTHLLLIVEKRAFPQAACCDGQLAVLDSVENVIYYNHWQVRHSLRFLYSASDDFSLARSMIEESPELANPCNPRIGVKNDSAQDER